MVKVPSGSWRFDRVLIAPYVFSSKREQSILLTVERVARRTSKAHWLATIWPFSLTSSTLRSGARRGWRISTATLATSTKHAAILIEPKKCTRKAWNYFSKSEPPRGSSKLKAGSLGCGARRIRRIAALPSAVISRMSPVQTIAT